jgi:hypothetical protein
MARSGYLVLSTHLARSSRMVLSMTLARSSNMVLSCYVALSSSMALSDILDYFPFHRLPVPIIDTAAWLTPYRFAMARCASPWSSRRLTACTCDGSSFAWP